MEQSIIERLRIRANIRRSISTRKSVQEGKPDKIADLLEEAADYIEQQQSEISGLEYMYEYLSNKTGYED